MKTSLQLFRVIALAAVIFGTALLSSAQKYELPAGLNEKSTLAEVIAWLDKNGFAGARIGLNEEYSQTYDPTDNIDSQRQSEWMVFDKGFTLSRSEGCNLILRNDDIRLLSYRSLYKDADLGSFAGFRNAADKKKQYRGDLYISLSRLKSKKSKIPYVLTKKDREEALLGKWRIGFEGRGADTEFIKHKWRVPNVEVKFHYDIYLVIAGSGDEGIDDDESFDSQDLTFTFDDKEPSDSFYAAFRQAIKLCRED